MAKDLEKKSKKRSRGTEEEEEVAKAPKEHKKSKKSVSSHSNGPTVFLGAKSTALDPTLSSLFATSVCDYLLGSVSCTTDNHRRRPRQDRNM